MTLVFSFSSAFHDTFRDKALIFDIDFEILLKGLPSFKLYNSIDI